MFIYLVTVQDRHVEAFSEAFTTFEQALAWSKDFLRAATKSEILEESDMEEEDLKNADWLYYKNYSTEGDYIYVRKVKLYGSRN